MKVLVLTGPTGVGKTEVAVELALRHGLDLVSADSRQVYTWLDIGTAKPDQKLRSRVPVHMVDMVDPRLHYSAADYARDALAVMRRLAKEARKFVVVGGSGLYIRAVFQPFFESPRPRHETRRRIAGLSTDNLYHRLERIDPVRASELHPNDRQRVARAIEIYEQTGQTPSSLFTKAQGRTEFEPVYVVLSRPRKDLDRRINERFDHMMKLGLLDEVRQLRSAGVGRGTRVANAYGYSELLAYLDGLVTMEDAVAKSKAKTRAYARRQLTWFRSLVDARWVEYSSRNEVLTTVGRILQEVVDR